MSQSKGLRSQVEEILHSHANWSHRWDKDNPTTYIYGGGVMDTAAAKQKFLKLIEQSNREAVRGLDKIDTKLAMVQSVDGLDEDVVNMLGNIRKDLSKFQYSDREGDTPDLSNYLQVEEEGDGNGRAD